MSNTVVGNGVSRVGEASATSRRSVLLIALVCAVVLAYIMVCMHHGGQFLVITHSTNIHPPKPASPDEIHRSHQKKTLWQEGSLGKLPSKNLLPKMWDKAVFSDVDLEAYRNMHYNESNRPLDMGLTSYNMSEVKLISPRGRNIQVGDILRYRIQSRDFNGRNRMTGGDFWYAFLTSTKNPKASTAGYIADYGNGTYDVFLLAAWSGNAKFELILVHVSETVYHMRNIVFSIEDRVLFVGHYQYKGKRAQGICSMRRQGAWTGMCEYPSYNALGSTIFLCEYRPGFPCESLVSLGIDKKRIDDKASEMMKGVEYLYKSPYYWQKVPVNSATLKVEGSELPPPKLHRCRADQPVPEIQGYWKDGKWNSLLCQFSDWTEKSSLTSCLRNKLVVIAGDSTGRQIRNELVGLLKMPNKLIDHTIWSKHAYESLNMILYWQFHPYVIGSSTYKLADMKTEVDTLNELNSPDCNYIVLVNQWAHFTQWTRDSYIERVRFIRQAVIGLRERCPDVPIVIKGPHAKQHENTQAIVYGSDYYLKQIELIIQDAFEGTGAFFLPVWDLNNAYPSRNNVHMPSQAVKAELEMFLGYVCDTLMPQE